MSRQTSVDASVKPYYLQRLNLTEDVPPTAPNKQINSGDDLQYFLTTTAYRDLGIWIRQLTRACFPLNNGDGSISPHQLDQPPPHSQAVIAIQQILSAAAALIERAPPDTGPRRFGNVAFRTWSSLLEATSESVLTQHLQPFLPSDHAITELKAYLTGSFGSAQRLDYGTGHELSYIAFLGALWKLNVFKDGEEWSIVSGTIQPYLLLVRTLIKTYTLEPAGSHGVWGLDDHSFLPYIVGSAQLSTPMAISSALAPLPTEGSWDAAPDPSSITLPATVNEQKTKNFYFAAIAFILDVKKGPFFEHSPYLYNISGIKDGWAKINKGMLKMYDAEVLSKFPVVQHFVFGRFWQWERDPYALAQPTTIHRQVQPGVVSSSAGTQAPWASSASQAPTNSTKAPWANNAGHAPIGSTSAPWASASRSQGPIARSSPRPMRGPADLR